MNNDLSTPNGNISSPAIPGVPANLNFNVPLASVSSPVVGATHTSNRGKKNSLDYDAVSDSVDVISSSAASPGGTSQTLPYRWNARDNSPKAPSPVTPFRSAPVFTLEVCLCALQVFLMFLYGSSLIIDASFKHAMALSDIKRGKMKPNWFFAMLGSVATDQGDEQLRQFLYQLPLVITSFSIIVAIARYIRVHFTTKLLQLFYIASGTILIMVLYGIEFLFCYLFFILNYVLIVRNHRRMPYWAYLALMWTFHVGLIVTTDYYSGFASMRLKYIEDVVYYHTGWKEMMRWNVLYKLSVLRMIAYDNDVREAAFYGAERREKAILKHDQTCVECAQLREANGGKIDAHPTDNNNNNTATRCYKFRTEASRPLEDYNFRSYLAYLLYPPLFLAGPIMSFNSFSSYCYTASLSNPLKKLVMYAVRIFIIFMCLEFIVHFVHTNIFRRSPEVFSTFTVAVQACFMFYMLAFLWLKFNMIWKTFRLFALIDGVEPPENMNRCFANTLTVQDFWRDWHSSFNQWVVRYMYIPMGGNKTRFLNIFPIFIFIGLWHDLNVNMVHWAGCIIAFFIVELSMKKLFGMRMFSRVRASKYYHYLLGIGGALSITGLIVANLVGFATVVSVASRTDKQSKTLTLVTDGLQNAGLAFFFLAFLSFYCTAQMARAERAMKENRQKRLKEQYGLLSRVDASASIFAQSPTAAAGAAMANGGSGGMSRVRLDEANNSYGDVEEGRSK